MYRLSTDYKRLFDLLLQGHQAAGFVTTKDYDNGDVVSVKRLSPWTILIGSRGISHGHVYPFLKDEIATELEAFVKVATGAGLQWIEPTPDAGRVDGHKPDCAWIQYERQAPCNCNPLAPRIAALEAQLADRNDAVIAQAGNVRALADALKILTQAARISGGVAGPDRNLMEACDKAENALSLTGVGLAVNVVLDVLEERDRLKSQLAESREREGRMRSLAADVCLASGYENARQAVIALNTELMRLNQADAALAAEKEGE